MLEDSSRTAAAAVYILGWYVFSLSLSVYNKWMFGAGLDFKYPIFITSFHQLCLMFLSTTVLYFRPSLRPTTNGPHTSELLLLRAFFDLFKMGPWVYVRLILPCLAALAGDIGLSNVSYKFILLSLYTMLKTSSLMFVLLFGLLFRLEKFNWRLVVIVGVMTASVMMMVRRLGPDEANSNSTVGIVLVLSASCVSGLRWSFTQLLLKHNSYTSNPISTIFYISPAMCVALFAVGLVAEGWGNFMSLPIWDLKGVLGTVGLMVLPGVLAFMMTLCEFKLLLVAQVITLSIAGIFKELLTIVVSAVIFGDRLSFVNCLGLVLTFADIMWYNYYRYYENQPSAGGAYAAVGEAGDSPDDEFSLGSLPGDDDLLKQL